MNLLRCRIDLIGQNLNVKYFSEVYSDFTGQVITGLISKVDSGVGEWGCGPYNIWKSKAIDYPKDYRGIFAQGARLQEYAKVWRDEETFMMKVLDLHEPVMKEFDLVNDVVLHFVAIYGCRDGDGPVGFHYSHELIRKLSYFKAGFSTDFEYFEDA
jgi:hypothetical protein